MVKGRWHKSVSNSQVRLSERVTVSKCTNGLIACCSLCRLKFRLKLCCHHSPHFLYFSLCLTDIKIPLGMILSYSVCMVTDKTQCTIKSFMTGFLKEQFDILGCTLFAFLLRVVPHFHFFWFALSKVVDSNWFCFLVPRPSTLQAS